MGAALEIFDSIIETSAPGALKFNPPPYEYEKNLMPFDILSGDSGYENITSEPSAGQAWKKKDGSRK